MIGFNDHGNIQMSGTTMCAQMPYDERDSKTGQFTPTYPREAFIDAVQRADGGITTREVSEEVECAYRVAYDRLSALEEDGRVTSRDVGSAKLWLLADDDRPEVSA
jgi:Fe2+ or Zn2+ uptake regulation protein